MAKRANGEGTIFYREDKKIWGAEVTLARHPGTGKITRRTVYGKTQKEVQAKINQLKKAQAEGTLRAPDSTTVEDWSKEYLENAKTRLKAGTYQSYEMNIRLYVLPYLGKIRLEKLTARDVSAMVNALAKEKGTRTSQYARTLLSMMLNYAVSLDMLPRNVAKNTRPPKAPRKEMSFWEPGEVRTFLKAISGHRLEALFYLALTTGMRKAELLGLRWSDLQGDTLSVRQTVVRVAYTPTIETPKTAAGVRDLVLDPDSLDQLRARRTAWEAERAAVLGAGSVWPDHDLIFPDQNGEPLMPWRIDYHWRTLRDGCEVSPIRFHDLRHTYASLAIASGMDVRMLAERLGHADASITLKVYSHVLASQRRRSAIGLGSLLETAERTSLRTATRTAISTDGAGQSWTGADEKAG
ncbi:tyrosine-type recombinase/integrase [Deinococcus multiflagellatus]|uniref:Tyrosine-type recombinase/integrase n=1 Tax=Deinococcus multiflagellatus TaxID=1656887 RepID=A0ABW1ZFM6_9DEIO|nr:tyrosine-type recombinase/integrase [Deinococcus multiflagellatus]MBZ9712232.1 site-specific integrase [Deinococcus multiflagellatus]